jgi:hypothetical protein
MIGIKSTRAVVLLGSLLLTLVITGGLFAYAYTTDTASITVDAVSVDFADVSANGTPLDYDIQGRVKGAIGAGGLFDITKDTNYTGDLEVIVSLANADKLVENYSFWMMRVEFTDSGLTKVDAENMTQVISLNNPEVTFYVDSSDLTGTKYVRTPGGSFRAFPAAGGLENGDDYDPMLFCTVVQATPQ